MSELRFGRNGLPGIRFQDARKLATFILRAVQLQQFLEFFDLWLTDFVVVDEEGFQDELIEFFEAF